MRLSEPQNDGPPQHILYWFLPLPDPIGLPDGYQAGFDFHKDSVEHLEAVERAAQAGKPAPPSETLGVSLRIWQRDESWDDPVGFGRLIEIAREAFPAQDRTPDDPESPRGEGRRVVASDQPVRRVTVIEAAVVFREGEPSTDEVSDAFDSVLECIRGVQRAYNMLTQWPMRLVAREMLPPMVPWALRVVDQEGDHWPDSFSVYMLHLDVAAWANPGPMDEEQLEALRVLLDREYAAFQNYADLRGETSVALYRRGDYRSTVLAAATAAEVFLDDLLLHLMWEEAVRPEAAAPFFTDPRMGILHRVKRHYHPRLGGSWRLDAGGPLMDWDLKILRFRHRVVHAGYSPTLDEAKDAFDALIGLEKYAADLLCSRADFYPRTALTVAGESGLSKRGLYSAKLRSLQGDPNEVPWVQTFARWREAVSRLRADAGGIGEAPNADRAKVIVVIHPDGREDWVLHDRRTSRAARTAAAWDRLTGAQADSVKALLASLPDRPDPVSIAVMMETTLPPVEAWVEQHRRIPLAGVMVDKKDFY